MSEESEYDQLLALLRKANLDYAKLADWLLQPENYPAYNAVPKLTPTTRNMLLPFLNAAIERHRAAELPLPEDLASTLQAVVYRIKVKKQTIYFVLVQCIRQLALNQSVLGDLLGTLETTDGVAHCTAAEDTIAIGLTGQLSLDDAATAITHALRRFLGEKGYIVEIDVE